MAQPTNTVSSYNIRGIKEDVDDKIYNLDASKTPFLSALPKFKVTQRTHQWQEDTYAAANKDNALIEGDDFVGQARTPTFVLANNVQTFSKQIVTSGIADAVSKYGRKEQMAYEMAKAAVELKKDIEAAFLSNNIAVVGTNSTAGKTAGLELFCTEGGASTHGVGGSTAALTSGVAPSTAPTDGTTRPLTEALLTATFREMWEDGAEPKICYLTMGQKSVVNGISGIAQRRVDVPPNGLASIIGAVDVYSWEMPISFVPVYAERMRPRTLFVTDGECIQRGTLRPIFTQKMGVTGDNQKKMMVTDAMLKVNNRKGVQKLADLS